MEAKEKRPPPAEKPLKLPMEFDDALRMVATGGKVGSQAKKKRRKR
jgi:hypothetical protein